MRPRHLKDPTERSHTSLFYKKGVSSHNVSDITLSLATTEETHVYYGEEASRPAYETRLGVRTTKWISGLRVVNNGPGNTWVTKVYAFRPTEVPIYLYGQKYCSCLQHNITDQIRS